MDRSEIIEGVTRTLLDYCECVDEGRPAEFALLFADDGVFADSAKPAVGREQIERRFRRLLASLTATSHHLSNVRVEPGADGRTASARSYVYAWHQAGDGSQFEVWGRYVDQLRLDDDGRWRFTHRQILVAGGRGVDVSAFPRLPRAAT